MRILFPSVDVFLALKEDPVYRERIANDHLRFADRGRKTRFVFMPFLFCFVGGGVMGMRWGVNGYMLI